MKKFSDYRGEDAIDLWADLLIPITAIVSDEEVIKSVGSGKPALIIAKQILKMHKSEAEQILLRIDDTPLNGLNMIPRLIGVIFEIIKNEDVMSFFESQGKEMQTGYSGSATENITAKETSGIS